MSAPSRPLASGATRRGGFTLIEVMLAISLMLALAGGMMSYIWGLLASRDRLVTASDQQISAAALFEQLETDLSTTFAADGSGEAGVKGTGTTLTVRSRGVGSLAAGGINDLGDLQGCDVRFDASARALTAHRLGRSEQDFETLASPVEWVRFRYLDGGAWKESFDSVAAGSPPSAVEVAIWFDTGDAAATGTSGTKGNHETKGTNGTSRTKGSRAASAGKGKGEEGGTSESETADDGSDATPVRTPDRVRVMVVPDGPVTSWKSHV